MFTSKVKLKLFLFSQKITIHKYFYLIPLPSFFVWTGEENCFW